MYRSFVMSWGNSHSEVDHDTLEDAVSEALRQDITHDFGDNGISMLRNLETGQRAAVGNGQTENVLGWTFRSADITSEVVAQVIAILKWHSAV